VKTRITSLVTLLACSALLVACSATQSTSGTHTTQGSDGNLAKRYTSIKSLTQDSAAVVIAKPTGKSVQEPADAAGTSGEFATVTPISIVKTLKGSTPSSTLRIRQLLVAEDTALVAGKTYVLFLTPFHFATAPDNGEWVITGAAGKYVVDGTDMSLPAGTPAGPPQQLTMSKLTAELG